MQAPVATEPRRPSRTRPRQPPTDEVKDAATSAALEKLSPNVHGSLSSFARQVQELRDDVRVLPKSMDDHEDMIVHLVSRSGGVTVFLKHHLVPHLDAFESPAPRITQFLEDARAVRAEAANTT